MTAPEQYYPWDRRLPVYVCLKCAALTTAPMSHADWHEKEGQTNDPASDAA